MRSLLFAPGDSGRKLEKAFSSEADVVIVDLEDSVAPDGKAAARAIADAFMRSNQRPPGGKVYVRVNDLGTGLTDDDLAAVAGARPDGIMLPKCAGGADVEQLSLKLRVQEAEQGLREGAIRIIPIVTETAAAVLAGASYRDPSPRLAALTWGAEDLSASIGALATRDELGSYTDVFRLARTVTLLAASAAGVAAIDTVFPDFRDAEGFGRECLAAARDGFTGKMAIHPAQVPVINAAFTPSPESVERAAEVVEAFRAAGDPGVVAIRGRMYDRPHLRLAERVLARARAAGVAQPPAPASQGPA